MVQLARHYGTGPASLAGIAAEEDLPRAYLEQLVVSLREAGLVVSTRGAHGGYELARAPEPIPMGDVLRALEGPIAPMMCASDDPEHATTCDRSSRCTVNVLWVRVRDAITGALDSMTLADLVPPATPRHPVHRPRSHAARSRDPLVTDQPTTDQHLVIRGLRVAPAASPDHEILQGIDLTVGKGEVHAIMGPNGSGKTTLAYALMGHPAYVIKGGTVTWKGRDILALSADKRARLGLFLAFQYPTAIPGLSVASFIRSALNAKLQGVDKNPDIDPTDSIKGGVSMRDFRNTMREKMALLKMDEGFASRYVNDGLLGRREEAPRDAPDGRPRAGDGDPRRDRLRARHRRPADRRRGRQRDAQPEPRRAADHPLPAAAQLHQARRRPRPGAGPHRQVRRQGPGAPPRGRGLRPDPARGRAVAPTCPTRRCWSPSGRPSSKPSRSAARPGPIR